MPAVAFTVDSRLLRELGARLVGKPHIALAELIKNSYDADASVVLINFSGSEITVTDDGHGMTSEEFQSRWMRIGSTHKEQEGVSRSLHRPLTGSKGVGRLAVQLLANKLELRSRSKNDPSSELRAFVDWDQAVEAGLLTTATADLTMLALSEVCEPENDQMPEHGVRLVLSDLNQEWGRSAFKSLAEEIWSLQPPFQDETGSGFRVVLESPDRDVVEEFQSRMTAILEIWSTRVQGRLLPLDAPAPAHVFEISNPSSAEGAGALRGLSRILAVSIEFAGEAPDVYYLRMPDCYIDRVQFEIRIFNLKNRQPFGISVAEARKYLNRYGGVHVYDAGFHLPYYGPESDWLNIEMDHSHRRGKSDYLPSGLQVSAGAEYLPTNSRIYGTVEVSTSHEGQWAREESAKGPRIPGGVDSNEKTVFPASEGLRIQVTRDRLVDTIAYRNLATLVRSAVDLYAMEQARRAFDAIRLESATRAPAPAQARDLATALELYRHEIPESVYSDLRLRVEDTAAAMKAEYDTRALQVGVLASLATAGVSALAYEHEVGKQFLLLDGIVRQLRKNPESVDPQELADQLEGWTSRARATRALFSPLLNSENRDSRGRLRARALIREVTEQVRGLARGVSMRIHVADDLRLPEGSFAEWSSLFQNVFINAFNAMLDSDRRDLVISSAVSQSASKIRIQDTGYGIDLSAAPRLFRPFERESGRTSPARAELGLGGTGLGLTIVAMLADELQVGVSFVEPDRGFATCFEIVWGD
jgi:signal transduction histidine kinase